MSKLNLLKKGLLSNTLNTSDLSKLKGGIKVKKPGGLIPPTGNK